MGSIDPKTGLFHYVTYPEFEKDCAHCQYHSGPKSKYAESDHFCNHKKINQYIELQKTNGWVLLRVKTMLEPHTPLLGGIENNSDLFFDHGAYFVCPLNTKGLAIQEKEYQTYLKRLANEE